jgi:hypothetical protein
MTMTLISTVTVGAGGSGSIVFSSIPQTATDLLVVWSLRNGSGSISDDLPIYFNSDTGNRSSLNLLGNGASTSSNQTTAVVGGVNGGSSTANTFSNGSAIIPNYTSTGLVKTFLIDTTTETNSANPAMAIFISRWNSTAAITTVELSGNGQTFVQNSIASLYGILKGSGGATPS